MKLHYLLGVALAFPLNAMATISTELSFGVPVFVITDTDLDDGVTPTLTWVSRISHIDAVSTALSLYQPETRPVRLEDDSQRRVSVPNWTDVQDVRAMTSVATASAAQNNGFDGMHFRVSSSVPGQLDTGSQAIVVGGFDGEFVFTGKGMLSIEVPYSMTISGDVENLLRSGDARLLRGHDLIGSQLSLDGTFGDSGSGLDVSTEVSCSASIHSGVSCGRTDGTIGPEALNDQGVLAGVLGINANNGAGSSGSVFVQGNSFLRISAAPVPEPETWAMLLSGLGLVGWAARRRRP